MKILSTYTDFEQAIRFNLVEIKCKSRSERQVYIETFENNGEFYVTDLVPGESFIVEISLDLDSLDSSGSKNLVINWICDATKVRGALHPIKESNTCVGEIDGSKVRESLQFTPQIVDKLGRVIHNGKKTKLWLEGRHAFFPMRTSVLQSHMSCFVFLEYDRITGPNAILSKECLQAVFNAESIFCDREQGGPTEGLATYFSLYEVWRQFIEIILNDDSVEGFDFGQDNDDTRLVVIVSRILREIFPGKEYDEVKNLRLSKYPEFCMYIQDYFFQRCK